MSTKGTMAPPNTIEVIGHGNPNNILVPLNPQGTQLAVLTVDDVERIILKANNNRPLNSGPFKPETVILRSCETGCLDNGFAQQLANRLGTTVIAPNTNVRQLPNFPYDQMLLVIRECGGFFDHNNFHNNQK